MTFLTAAEIVTLTGYVRPAKQREFGCCVNALRLVRVYNLASKTWDCAGLRGGIADATRA